jgi:signal transduction histidine kinase
MIKRFPGPNMIIDFSQLQEDERAVVRAIRQNDLERIQTISVYSLFPIALLSFALGYLLSGRFLDPINKLKKNIDTITRTELGKDIPVEIEDEVGGLIMSFNELSHRLKNSFEVQERFVQDASHELKTPLTIIQTNLDTVVDDTNSTKEELNASIKKALNGVKELRTLTNYLLDLTVNQEITLDEINLSKILSNQVNKLKQIATNDHVSLKFDTSLIKEDVFVKADEITLGRAMFNIIENAIKYSDKSLPKGESFVRITLEKDKEMAIIKIVDNGIGIPKELQEKIFERFFRIEKSRSKKLGGFGLGLAISKKAIDNLNGNIEVKSKENDTTFTITLPLFKK